MPYEYVYRDPELLVSYAGEDIYRTYDDNDWESPSGVWFALSGNTDPDSVDEQFDALELPGITEETFYGPRSSRARAGWDNCWPFVKAALDGGYLDAYVANRALLVRQLPASSVCLECGATPVLLPRTEDLLWCVPCGDVFPWDRLHPERFTVAGTSINIPPRIGATTTENVYTLLSDLRKISNGEETQAEP